MARKSSARILPFHFGSRMSDQRLRRLGHQVGVHQDAVVQQERRNVDVAVDPGFLHVRAHPVAVRQRADLVDRLVFHPDLAGLVGGGVHHVGGRRCCRRARRGCARAVRWRAVRARPCGCRISSRRRRRSSWSSGCRAGRCRTSPSLLLWPRRRSCPSRRAIARRRMWPARAPSAASNERETHELSSDHVSCYARE